MKKMILAIVAVMLLISGSVYADTSDEVVCDGPYNKGQVCDVEKPEDCPYDKGVYCKANDIESIAAAKGMSVEEYKEKLAAYKAEKPQTKEEFLAALEEKGITLEEYKAMVVEKYEKMAEEKGMTLEELKEAMIAQKANGRGKGERRGGGCCGR